jgi:hypothetical protein
MAYLYSIQINTKTNTMKTYKVKTEDGKYVERFFGASVLVTENPNGAREYTKAVIKKKN